MITEKGTIRKEFLPLCLKQHYPDTGRMENIENIWQVLRNRLEMFILRRIPDKAVAGDILQEVFIKIHSKIDTVRDDTRIQPWIFRITQNLINDHYRREKRNNSAVRQIPDLEEDKDPEDSQQEALADMLKMMDGMPASYCDSLCMTELGGMSLREYAQKAGITYTAAKSRVQRARKLLKDMLMNCCHYEFDRYGTVLDITPKQCCCCHPGH